MQSDAPEPRRDSAANGVTPRQLRTIEALLTAPSMIAAAHQAGVPERTVSRWLTKHHAFQAALNAASRARLADTVRRLRAASGRALDTLLGLLNDESPTVRLRAAERLLDCACRVEVDELAARVAALEGAQQRATR